MYNQQFYDTIRQGTRDSAAVVVPLVLWHIARQRTLPDEPYPSAPGRVIDVGCGEGWWAQAFADQGCEVIGVDGAYVQDSPLGDRFLPHDLTKPLPDHLAGRFDLAVSLEVAEHLPETRAASFINELCQLAPVVLFSAAIPGQGGTGHINERWPGYWVRHFQRNEFSVSGALRWELWDDDRVENWYRQNLLVAVRDPQRYPDLFDTPLAKPHALVHPVLYNARRGA